MIDGSTIFNFLTFIYLSKSIVCILLGKTGRVYTLFHGNYVILDKNRTNKIDNRLDIFRESVKSFCSPAFPPDNDIRMTPSDHLLTAGAHSGHGAVVPRHGSHSHNTAVCAGLFA